MPVYVTSEVAEGLDAVSRAGGVDLTNIRAVRVMAKELGFTPTHDFLWDEHNHETYFKGLREGFIALDRRNTTDSATENAAFDETMSHIIGHLETAKTSHREGGDLATVTSEIAKAQKEVSIVQTHLETLLIKNLLSRLFDSD